MAKLMQCDRCGKIDEPENMQSVEINFWVENKEYYQELLGMIVWKGETTPKKTKRDLCFNCWRDFLDDFSKFFSKI